RPVANQLVQLAVAGTDLVGFVCVYGAHDPQWGSLIDNLHRSCRRDTRLIRRVMPSKRSESEMQSDLTLRRPREGEEEEFLRAHGSTSPEVPSFLHYYADAMPFRRYLEVLAEQEQGVNLPANHVPSTFLFAFVGTRIVGRASIRHSLNAFLH